MQISTGQRTFNFALKVPTANASAVEEVLRAHQAFMQEHHSLDSSKIELHHYYVSKAEELNNPIDPSQGLTGNLLYTINEVYRYAEGIDQHMGQAMAWDQMGQFLELLGTYGQVVIVNGEVIMTL